VPLFLPLALPDTSRLVVFIDVQNVVGIDALVSNFDNNILYASFENAYRVPKMGFLGFDP